MAVRGLVIAHKRKEFIEESASSCLKEFVHCIVMKNFEDDSLDERLRKLGVDLLTSKEEGVGAKIVEGVETLNSTHVALLEDDDLFLSGKRDTVDRLIEKGFSYVHNNQRYFYSDKGKVKDGKTFEPFTGSNDLRKIHKVKGYFNASSMVVSSDSILSSGELKHVMAVADVPLYFLSLIYGERMFFLPTPLTLLRIHDSFSNFMGKRVEEIRTRAENFFGKAVEDFRLVEEIGGGTPFEDYALDWSAFVRVASSFFTLKEADPKDIERVRGTWVPYGSLLNRLVTSTVGKKKVNEVVLKLLALSGITFH